PARASSASQGGKTTAAAIPPVKIPKAMPGPSAPTTRCRSVSACGKAAIGKTGPHRRRDRAATEQAFPRAAACVAPRGSVSRLTPEWNPGSRARPWQGWAAFRCRAPSTGPGAGGAQAGDHAAIGAPGDAARHPVTPRAKIDPSFRNQYRRPQGRLNRPHREDAMLKPAAGLIGAVALMTGVAAAQAQDTVKIGLIMTM